MIADGSARQHDTLPDVPPARPTRARPMPALLLLLMFAAAGCEVVEDAPRADTAAGATAAAVAPPGGGAGALATDSAAGTVVAPAESASTSVAADDTGAVRLHPSSPRRGGVLFALAEGVAAPSPRCTWKGDPIPCYRADSGVLVMVPLPADEEAGTYTLTIDRPAGRIVRQITVADREFGRELVFLADSLYELATSTGEIARDARAIRGIVDDETAERRWSGPWRDPVQGAKTEGYGVERFYYRATDSTRSITLDREARSRGAFGGDTSEAAFRGAPSWRHAGVDIAARRRTPVVAPAGGIVADIGEYVLTGRTVLVDHGQGVFSAFFHLDTATVRKGDLVRAGQRVGRVGATGLATGPHLHYGIYIHGKDVDPAAWRDMPAWAR